MKIKNVIDKKIAILGYGKEGKSTEKFLRKLGIKNYSIFDKNINTPTFKDTKIYYGKDYLNNIKNFDIIFKTPGISIYNNKKLLNLKNKITSQAEIFADNFEGKIIGITGTKGKSTTSTLLFKILKNLNYNVKLVGNIGNPVLDEINILDSKNNYDYIIYELSSYMLDGLKLNIFIGLLNNIYKCHLDWHNGIDNYTNAKFNILKNSKHKLVSYELKDTILSKFKNNQSFLEGLDFFGLEGKYKYKKYNKTNIQGIKGFFYINNKKIIEDKNIKLGGIHNKKNISGIIGILDKIGIFKNTSNIKNIKEVLINFGGLPNRQENIGTYKGIIFINDANATTPESTIAAIKRFGNKIGTILIGNEDSGFDFTNLLKTIKKYNIPNIVLFPETGEKLFGTFSKNMTFNKEYIYKNKSFKAKLLKTLSMEKAIEFSYNNTKKGDIVLLSTGAPSFNANGKGKMPWKNYLEKAKLFKKYVEKYGIS